MTFYFFSFLVFTLASCSKDLEERNGLEGRWKLVSTSGGIHGVGYNANFSELAFDADLAFEILLDDNVLAKGHVEELEHMHFENYIKLVSDQVFTTEKIEILEDNEKEAKIDQNTLTLMSDCCDRYDTTFERIK